MQTEVWHNTHSFLVLPDSIIAGKSTLLQLLAGKKLANALNAVVRVHGRDVFRDFQPGITFLGTEWFVVSHPQNFFVTL